MFVWLLNHYSVWHPQLSTLAATERVIAYIKGRNRLQTKTPPELLVVFTSLCHEKGDGGACVCVFLCFFNKDSLCASGRSPQNQLRALWAPLDFCPGESPVRRDKEDWTSLSPALSRLSGCGWKGRRCCRACEKRSEGSQNMPPHRRVLLCVTFGLEVGAKFTSNERIGFITPLSGRIAADDRAPQSNMICLVNRPITPHRQPSKAAFIGQFSRIKLYGMSKKGRRYFCISLPSPALIWHPPQHTDTHTLSQLLHLCDI